MFKKILSIFLVFCSFYQGHGATESIKPKRFERIKDDVEKEILMTTVEVPEVVYGIRTLVFSVAENYCSLSPENAVKIVEAYFQKRDWVELLRQSIRPDEDARATAHQAFSIQEKSLSIYDKPAGTPYDGIVTTFSRACQAGLVASTSLRSLLPSLTPDKVREARTKFRAPQIEEAMSRIESGNRIKLTRDDIEEVFQVLDAEGPIPGRWKHVLLKKASARASGHSFPAPHAAVAERPRPPVPPKPQAASKAPPPVAQRPDKGPRSSKTSSQLEPTGWSFNPDTDSY